MGLILLLGVVAAVAAAVLARGLAGPKPDGRAGIVTVVAALGAIGITAGVGGALSLAPVEYLIGAAAFTLPLLVFIDAAGAMVGEDRVSRRLLLLGWAWVVFPASALVPLAAARACASPECVVEDFGAALPLLVSSSAYVLLAGSAGVRMRRPAGRRAMLLGLALWAVFTVWLMHLEGAVDAYTARILVAVVVASAASVAGWLLTDRLRATPASATRAVVGGSLAGAVAIAPGAVSIALPWSAIVGALAGAAAAAAYSGRTLERSGDPTRWGIAVLIAASVGFLAPPVSGEAIGVMFSGQFGVVWLPVVLITGVVGFALLASAPGWLLLRHRSGRLRSPRRPVRG